MADDQDNVDNVCDRIDAATKDSDNETVYAALICIWTYRMSLEHCDHSREAVIRHLKESLSDILRNANREAAARAAREGEHAMTCH
jgi:hypothetical protein